MFDILDSWSNSPRYSDVARSVHLARAVTGLFVSFVKVLGWTRQYPYACSAASAFDLCPVSGLDEGGCRVKSSCCLLRGWQLRELVGEI
jgi:hypothetical protein